MHLIGEAFLVPTGMFLGMMARATTCWPEQSHLLSSEKHKHQQQTPLERLQAEGE